MKVLFFSNARVAAGLAEDDLLINGSITEEVLWQKLVDRYPGLNDIRGVTRLAKNGAYVGADVLFINSDEVALIPPVSGG